jgi:hypothetical protein
LRNAARPYILGLVDVYDATIPTLTVTPGVHFNYAVAVPPMRDSDKLMASGEIARIDEAKDAQQAFSDLSILAERYLKGELLRPTAAQIPTGRCKT